MEVTSYWALLTVLFGLLTVLATTSGLINANLWISEPLACALVGFAIGPMGFGVVFYGHHEAPLNLAFLHQTARFTLALAVTGAAMRLPAGWLRRNWRGMLVVLGPGMLLMAAASTCVAVITLGVPLLTAALIGCSLTPTDPVLSPRWSPDGWRNAPFRASCDMASRLKAAPTTGWPIRWSSCP